MDIRPCGSQASRRASADWFTGVVWQDPVIEAPALPAGVRATLVRFDPSARTHWHTHPLGQTLYIVSGIGRVQAWGGNIREVRAGDVVWFPPGEKHWHGAGPSVGMAPRHHRSARRQIRRVAGDGERGAIQGDVRPLALDDRRVATCQATWSHHRVADCNARASSLRNGGGRFPAS